MLVHSTPSVGASSRPEVIAAATCQTDTVEAKPGQRDHTARAAVKIAATASPSGDPAGSGITGTDPTATAKVVNPSRTGPARASNRRNQPRTVAAGRSTSPATRR